MGFGGGGAGCRSGRSRGLGRDGKEWIPVTKQGRLVRIGKIRTQAELSVVPVHRGYWGNKIGKPHTVTCKVLGKCGSVLVGLIPAPRGTVIVSAPVPKKLLQMAGIEDCYTMTRGLTTTLGNFAKDTYAFPTPDLCKNLLLSKTSYQKCADFLEKTKQTGQRIIEL